MKNIEERLIELLSKGFCTPQISAIARKLKEPPTTLHYNIKKLEQEGKTIVYKAVFDYAKINRGFCSYALVNLSHEEYVTPERIARDLAVFEEIESIDIVTGDWELVVKVRTKNIEEYYHFLRTVLSRKGIIKISSLNSLKQIKTEFIQLEK